MSSDVELTVWDKTRTERVWIGDPIQLVVTARHNQQPTAALTVPFNHPRADRLQAPGSRIVVRYRGEHLFSGPWTSFRTEGNARNRRLIVEYADDWRLMAGTLLWPVPGSAITSQSGAEYHVVTGAAETVAKTLLGAAITRLGLPITVAADQERGATITVKGRMNVPADVLLPALDQAGIGLTVQQDHQTGELVLDAYEPTAWTAGVLSEGNGTLRAATWSRTAPTCTRTVLGADGEGTARAFRATADTGLEGEWGYVAEVFVDARDLKSSDGGFTAEANARMAEALAAGAPTAGLSVQLAEAGRFRYGGPAGVHVGDVVSVELVRGATPVTDVLRAATLTWDRRGARVTPVIGERRDDPDTNIARAISAAHRALRALQTRR